MVIILIGYISNFYCDKYMYRPRLELRASIVTYSEMIPSHTNAKYNIHKNIPYLIEITYSHINKSGVLYEERKVMLNFFRYEHILREE